MALSFVGASGSGEVVGGTTITWAHDVGTGSGRVLVVVVALNNTRTVSGVTYNGVAMTQMWSKQESALGAISSAGYILANPASGSNNVVVTASGTMDVGLASAQSWDGGQAVTASAFRTAATAEGPTTSPATCTVDVTNAQVGDVIVDGLATGGNTATPAFTSRNVQTTTDNLSEGTQSTAGTGSTVTMSWTHEAGEQIWALGAAALIPGAGGGGSVAMPPAILLMGVQ